MGREQTFLDRIASGGGTGGSAPSAREDPTLLMESVRKHLKRLLNSRRGMSEALPDYGLPALSDLRPGSGDHTREMQEAIRRTIEKYEPRLTRVRVVQEEDEDLGHQVLAFRIEGVLVGEHSEHRVWYQTAVKGDGYFDVAG